MLPKWTDAHRREALRRTYELAAEVTARGIEWWGSADMLCARPTSSRTEHGWRSVLADAGLDPARIEREVRRVRGLAEGRLVRETVVTWEVRWPHAHLTFSEGWAAHRRARKLRRSVEPVRVVRVTVRRIRRAP